MVREHDADIDCQSVQVLAHLLRRVHGPRARPAVRQGQIDREPEGISRNIQIAARQRADVLEHAAIWRVHVRRQRLGRVVDVDIDVDDDQVVAGGRSSGGDHHAASPLAVGRADHSRPDRRGLPARDCTVAE